MGRVGGARGARSFIAGVDECGRLAYTHQQHEVGGVNFMPNPRDCKGVEIEMCNACASQASQAAFSNIRRDIPAKERTEYSRISVWRESCLN